jgi:bisphosphoglycerate-dependent phosphoglycerate mutase
LSKLWAEFLPIDIMNLKTILFAASALILIWSGVGAIMSATEKHTSTPEKVLARMATAPWLDGQEVSDAARRKHLDGIIEEVNKLDFDQRRQMREGDKEIRERFFNSLATKDKGYFLENTVEQHFKSVMKAFNKMPREERQKLVQQSMNDMKKSENDDRNMKKLKEEDEKVFETVVEKGLGSYYQDASAETKMDLAPLMEQMQQRLRGFGHH